jgi:hypothetical protein
MASLVRQLFIGQRRQTPRCPITGEFLAGSCPPQLEIDGTLLWPFFSSPKIHLAPPYPCTLSKVKTFARSRGKERTHIPTCLAILEDALKYLEARGGYGGHITRARYRHEAWEWFLSDAEYCLSFTIVCAVLDLNAEAVRRAVRRRLAQGDAALSDVSRGPRQPLSRVSSARSARRTGARSSLKKTRDVQGIEGNYFSVRGKRKASREK